MSVLNQALYLLLKLIADLGMVYFDFVEPAPPVTLRPYDVFLRSWKLRDVMHLENISPYLFPTSIHRCEALYEFSILLECCLVSDGRCVKTPSEVFSIRGTVFHISRLFSSISLLFLNATLCICHYFRQVRWWPLGREIC